ncbi:hypothetical protein [Limosilactobacillus fermentum]
MGAPSGPGYSSVPGSAVQQEQAIILTYLIVGIFCFFMMRALGELLLADPSKYSFIDSVKNIGGTGWNLSPGGRTGPVGYRWQWPI